MRYVPKSLSVKDKKKQISMIQKSRKNYAKRRRLYPRKKLKSFKSVPSKHVVKAKQLYKVNQVSPNQQLAKATGCSVSALKQIVKKGEGAYYSSGSRPNQTAQSWGLARLASSITGGNSSWVDLEILRKGCQHSKKAFQLARKKPLRKTRKIKV